MTSNRLGHMNGMNAQNAQNEQTHNHEKKLECIYEVTVEQN